MRTQEERDRQTVRITMTLPLVVLGLILSAPMFVAAAALGLLDGFRPGVVPVLAAAYFTFVAIRIAHRHR